MKPDSANPDDQASAARVRSRGAEHLEPILESFEQAWACGERPVLSDYLPAESSRRLPLLIELVHSDLEFRLKNGEAARVEEYLRRYPELVREEAAVLDLITAEWQLRRRRGEATAQEYLDRFPQYAEAMRPRLIDPPGIETLPYRDQQQTQDEHPRAAADRGAPDLDIPDYEILEELGRGGMGVVYKARHLGLKRLVALKMILAGPYAGPEALARFRIEAESVARLQHPNIVQIYDVGEHAGMSYFSLEYLSGGSLVNKLEHQPQPGRDAAALVETLALAMHYAHTQGIVHRDLKPANVLLASDGTPKLADFGLAKRLDDASLRTATGALLGTPCYMAPEQADGKIRDIGPLTDVYALGALLYEMLTGRPPFQADTPLATVRLVLTQDPVPPSRLQPRVHRDLETVCLKALAKEPRQRYESALALAEDLARFQHGDAVLARCPGAIAKGWRKVRRNPLPYAVLAGILLLALVSPVVVRSVMTARRQSELAELNRTFEAELDQPHWEEDDYLNRMDAHLEALAQRTPEAAAAARQRLHQHFAEHIERRIFAATLSPTDLERLRTLLDRLAQRDEPSAARLRAQLADRQKGTQQLFHLRVPFAGLDAVFDPGRVRVEGDALLASTEAGKPVLTRVACPGDGEYVAVFAAQSWQEASRLGLLLQGEKGYGFFLRSADLSSASPGGVAPPISFASARRQKLDFVLEIQRRGVRVRVGTVKAGEVPPGPLRLEARRAGDRLLFQVNNLTPLEFQDVFPLGGDPGNVYGLEWPGGVQLESLRAYQQTLAPLASPLERGDELYARRRFEEALLEYRAQANTSAQPEVRQQARYKEGLCLLGRNQAEQAASLFQHLAEEPAVSERWALLARCQIWLRLLGQGRLDEADAQFALIKNRYAFQELAALLPPDLRDGILRAYADAGGANLVLIPPETLVRNQERNLAVLTFLQSPPTILRGARHQLLRVCRMAGDERRAIRLGDEILADHPALEASDMVRQTLVQHTWALCRVGEARRALAELDHWLFASPGVDRADIQDNHALLIERTRAKAALQQWQAAEEDLARFFRLHPAASGRPDPLFVDACLLQGFLRQRRGDAVAAQQAWNRGLPASDIFQDSGAAAVGGSQFVHFLILATLTGRLTDEEAARAGTQLFSGLVGNSSSRRRLAQLYKPPPAVLRRMWQTPRGSEWARRIAYRDLSLAEYSRVPVFLLGYEMLHQGALPETLSPEQDQLLWQLVQDLYFRYLTGKVKEDQATSLALAWMGFFGSSWESALAKLDAPLRSPIAYLAGQRCLRKGKSREQEALRLFELACKEGTQDSLSYQLAKKEIDKIRGK